LKRIILKPKALGKIKNRNKEFFQGDFEEIPRSCVPGEWVYITDYKNNIFAVGFVNCFVLHGPIVRIVKFTEEVIKLPTEIEVAKSIIVENLANAFSRRNVFKTYSEGARLVFGDNDYLPGLIVDRYKNAILVQINTAGLDRYRDFLKEEIEKSFEGERVFFHDNAEYRKTEVLPEFDLERFDEDLEILENGFSYNLPAERIQKIGYYYDHRENRAKLEKKIADLNVDKTQALDLFSYIGSWGLHLLRAGIENVTFVDQADMESITNDNLKRNSFENKGQFVRKDVFSFIGEQLSKNNKYNIIVSDPPAFTKSEKNKNKALVGYEKLHTKLMQILHEKSLLVVASCTHYVSLKELDETVKKAAVKVGRDAQVLDLGIQGHDHVFYDMKDKSNYIKYILYYVE